VDLELPRHRHGRVRRGPSTSHGAIIGVKTKGQVVKSPDYKDGIFLNNGFAEVLMGQRHIGWISSSTSSSGAAPAETSGSYALMGELAEGDYCPNKILQIIYNLSRVGGNTVRSANSMTTTRGRAHV